MNYLGTCLRTAKELATYIADRFSLTLHLSTVRSYLQQLGYRYKRMRLSLKDKRDPVLFEVFSQELKQLKELEDQGEIDLYFFDEMGLTLTPKVPYAWQPIGQTACLPAAHSPTLTTLAFVNRKMDLQSFVFKGPADSLMAIACVEQFVEQINKKTVVIMDNAPIHKSKAFTERLNTWKQKGLFIQFIPAYCPELNYIERLWKHIKYQCLPTEAFKNLNTLELHLDDVLTNFFKKYQFNFS